MKNKKSDQKDNRQYESFMRLFLRRFKQNRMAMFSFYSIIVLLLIGILAPLIANNKPIVMVREGEIQFPGMVSYPEYKAVDWDDPEIEWDYAIFPLVRNSPTEMDLKNRLEPPSKEHWFGTDDLGMDVFARIIWGTRISMSIGIVAAMITLVVGTIMGALAGYLGGWVDMVISRFIEIMMSFPTFFLILAVIAVLPPSIYNIMIVIGLTKWTTIARLVRGEVLKVKSLDYIHAAKVNGSKSLPILMKHVIPNAIMPALISATFEVARAILVESSLSFLGFGVQPPTPSWGAIIHVAQDYILTTNGQWLSWFPAIAIFITVTTYNLLGQSIRDAADPRLVR